MHHRLVERRGPPAVTKEGPDEEIVHDESYRLPDSAAELAAAGISLHAVRPQSTRTCGTCAWRRGLSGGNSAT